MPWSIRPNCSPGASTCCRASPCPRYLRVVEALPKTPSQRIQKYKLRADGITADTVDRHALGIVAPRS